MTRNIAEDRVRIDEDVPNIVWKWRFIVVWALGRARGRMHRVHQSLPDGRTPTPPRQRRYRSTIGQRRVRDAPSRLRRSDV